LFGDNDLDCQEIKITQKQYKPSFYNLIVSHGSWTLLFNGVTSGLMRLPKELADQLIPFLGDIRNRSAGSGLKEWNCQPFFQNELPTILQSIFNELLRGRFLIPNEEDEFSHLKVLVTITTTMDCNLDCYYCFEDKSKIRLTSQSCDQILDWIKEQIDTQGHKRLYTDWYGGEPMLNQDAIEYFSTQIIEYCDSKNIDYSSSIISNGTIWPEDSKSFVQRTRIRHVQFTMDGPRQHHDRRRHYVASTTAEGLSSFDRIAETIDRLIGFVRIYLRINVDPWIGRDALLLIEFFKEKGWFKHGTHFYPYLAMIGPMTEHCGFLGNSHKILEFRNEFDKLNQEFQYMIAQYMDPRGIQHLQYYPMTKKINCAAVGHNSVIFGPDGLMYKCGLEVGNSDKAHDKLLSSNSLTIPTIKQNKKSPFIILNQPKSVLPNRWKDYDPFSHPKCSQCQYLPICMGGCPKVHFDKNEFYLEQQCKYWEENFDSIIRTYYDTARSRHY
jgi:uncharacterized protein